MSRKPSNVELMDWVAGEITQEEREQRLTFERVISVMHDDLDCMEHEVEDIDEDIAKLRPERGYITREQMLEFMRGKYCMVIDLIACAMREEAASDEARGERTHGA